MDVSILVEPTYDGGETKRLSIGQLRHAADESGSEILGLLLDGAKTLLRRLQEAIVQDQVGEAIEPRRKCDGFGKQRAIHDDRVHVLDTLFGRNGQGFDAACANRMGSRNLDRNHHLPG